MARTLHDSNLSSCLSPWVSFPVLDGSERLRTKTKILHMVQTQNKSIVQNNSPTSHMFEASCMKKKNGEIF